MTDPRAHGFTFTEPASSPDGSGFRATYTRPARSAAYGMGWGATPEAAEGGHPRPDLRPGDGRWGMNEKAEDTFTVTLGSDMLTGHFRLTSIQGVDRLIRVLRAQRTALAIVQEHAATPQPGEDEHG